MLVRNLISGIVGFFAVLVGSSSAQQPSNIEYAALKPCQTARFLATGQSGWNSLDDSQRLQFAGGTQALNTIMVASSPCKSLAEISGSRAIFGSIPDAPSAAQFHIDVKWMPDAGQVFAGAKGWGPHLAWLHPGQQGSQENRNWNPFLGIVVLFDDDDKAVGQFHIGFRSLFWHYFSDNGNIAKNYRKYCQWYGQIDSYTPECPAVPTQVNWGNNPPPPQRVPSSDLRQTARDFLQTWYVEQNLDWVGRFVAEDDSTRFLITRGVLPKGTFMSYWASLFDSAFDERPGAVKFDSLKEAIGYPEPSRLRSQPKLTNLNEPLEDYFAIISPDSAADSVFPQSGIPAGQLDPPAQFLRHLREKYYNSNPGQNGLNLVVYTTNGQGLVRETSVLYWIKEQTGWKLAAFQGTY
jgi:hypothetical protein